jgi:hypothetical protein
MTEILNIDNLMRACVILIGWTIRQQLEFIKLSIDDDKKSANQAHERIDTMLSK